MDRDQFVAELAKLRPASMFLAIKGYRNEASEIADYSIAFHMSYRSALQKSITILQQLSLSDDLEKQACAEQLTSFQHALATLKDDELEKMEDGYQRFFDDDGNHIKGIKLLTSNDTLYLYGLVAHKRVLIPGFYKEVNSKPLTIAKSKLRYLTPVGKFRQFRITPNRVDQICVQNLSLLPPI